ncbi:HD domain-containing protein [Sphingomonas naphthae]|uniref:HD domain-containing protein n=1 Tax=Sphingomonas naphthae TaxID=1813468 RepID=A0ABY7THV9_9SPHN|nr:HD-GYP domain-containing protein [Sphingomonas naphthae]WCT72525.1 HD domain-containing protein [Sphingomonas naphthae]
MPLAELLGAFSHALDLTEGQPVGHCLRTCWIGSRIGRFLGLDAQDLHDLYYVLLLKDLGCSSNAARISALYLADDRRFKGEYKLVGEGVPAVLRFLFATTGRGAPAHRKMGALMHILRNGGTIAQEMIETRCTRGAEIARTLRFSEGVAAGIYSLDEHWDGTGRPRALAGEAIPLFSRIALLAQVAEVFHAAGGPDAAIAEVRRRCGSWFDPALVRAFNHVVREPRFWEDLANHDDIEALVLTLEPGRAAVIVDEDYLDDIVAAFGQVIDAKSPYTAGHSHRTADLTVKLAARLGLDPAVQRWLRRGAFLHDIGKLAVSSAILDKPGRLDPAEWAEIRGHAAQTQAILGRISALADIAPIAAAHHERLDGRGYPQRLSSTSISLPTRIITICDWYDALTSERPYRPALTTAQALEVIEREVGRAIDRKCFMALREMCGDREEVVAA